MLLPLRIHTWALSEVIASTSNPYFGPRARTRAPVEASSSVTLLALPTHTWVPSEVTAVA